MARTLITGGIILPMDGKDRVVRGKSLLIDGDRIAGIGDAGMPPGPAGVDRIVDATGKAVLPGIVNAHTHVGPTGILRGIAEDLSFDEFMALSSRVRTQAMTPDDYHAAARLGCLEVLKSGATCINELGHDMEATARALEESGLRGILAPDVHDLSSRADYARGIIDHDPEVGEERVAVALGVLARWRGAANGRIACRLANYSPLTCSAALLKRTRALADQHGVGINVHVLSTQKGAERGRAVFGQDTMVFLNEIGYLGPQVTLVHLVHPTDGDIAAVRESGAKLVHCPLALAKAGECAPLGAIYAAGIEVSLGSDWLMMDPWEQMRFAIVLARVTTRSTPVIDAYDALAMSTIRAARAVGLDHEIGSLEVGKKADVILVDLDQPHLAPLGEDYDPVKTLVHNATGRDVVSVLVDGEVVVADRRALRVDEHEVMATAERHARAVLSRAAALAR